MWLEGKGRHDKVWKVTERIGKGMEGIGRDGREQNCTRINRKEHRGTVRNGKAQ